MGLALLVVPLMACGAEPPTGEPAEAPTVDPTPTQPPTSAPTEPPSAPPTVSPTPVPMETPMVDPTPAQQPTPMPTERPAPTPTQLPTPAPTEQPTATPTPTESPTPTPTPARTPAPTVAPVARDYSQELLAYAAEYSNGPGAIYVGDVSQLEGPAPVRELGDRDGNVSLGALQENSWVFWPDYYYSLLEKAKLTESTPLSSSGEQIEVQFACINRGLYSCQLLTEYFAPNVYQRTKGQVRINISSYPELGVPGRDILELLGDGRLESGTVFSAYISATIPQTDIQNLWGIYSSGQQALSGIESSMEEVERLILEGAGGGAIINRSWSLGDDQYIFCSDGGGSPGDIRNKDVRSPTAPISDWLRAMGANADFYAFGEVHRLISDGDLDCGVTSPSAAHGQRWYEVTDYMIGPLHHAVFFPNVINTHVWARIPTDLQQIILEEGAKSELEAFRLGALHNTNGLSDNIDQGLEHISFSDEMMRRSRQAAIAHVIPNWVNRVGDPSDPIVTETFNEKLGPIVGLRINPDGTVTDTGEPATVPAATATATTTQPGKPPASQTLEAYANDNANGPGAIFVGDLSQLTGPAPVRALGDRDGDVPMDALQRHSYIYGSDYYRSLLDRAGITDPTPLTSQGERIEIQFACASRPFLPCNLFVNYFASRVMERTNGQVRFETTSFAERNVPGPDILDFVSDGTLDSATIYGNWISFGQPVFEIQALMGVFATVEESYAAAASMISDVDSLAIAGTGGGAIFSHSWYPWSDLYLFCREAVRSTEDFHGRGTRTFGASLSDWINGMGGKHQYAAFAEVYTWLERDLMDCAFTGAGPGYAQRWYEVTDYVAGPLYNLQAHANAINRDTWNGIPRDLQQIILEEGARLELEALRLVPAQAEVGLTRLLDAGMEYIPFSGEMAQRSRQVAVEQVIPAWVERVGDPGDPIITETFNEKLGPIVGMRINADGTVTDLR